MNYIMDKPDPLNEADGETVDAMISDSDKCYICLSPFEKQTVGSLDGCTHFFCFECIYQWSQVNAITKSLSIFFIVIF